jgi:hypothetical protein
MTGAAVVVVVALDDTGENGAWGATVVTEIGASARETGANVTTTTVVVGLARMGAAVVVVGAGSGGTVGGSDGAGLGGDLRDCHH